MTWNLKKIEELAAAGKIRGFKDITKKEKKVAKSDEKKPKTVQKIPKALQFIQDSLDVAGITYVTEHRFDEERRFRFDIAILDKKIAIEYEGLMSAKSRHTTSTGFTRDATKYNLAQSQGWKVYRYTTLNYKEFESDLKKIISE